ncbi:MAG: HAD family hydrolase [Bacillota bacterium]
MYNTVLFDLDGTLTNPKLGITTSVAYALAHFGIAVDDLDSLIPFIGPPLVDSFAEFYGFNPEKSQLAVDKYREYFSVKGLYQNEVYAGVPEMLSSLKARGKKLIIATSKPEIFARRILDHFDLSKYFDDIVGATEDRSRNNKGAVIAHAIATCDISCNSTVMVGDRMHDLIGAAENNLPAIGVLYGFGDAAELSQYNPISIEGTIASLSAYLLAH